MYRTAIIGRGLIGSAAARHLSLLQDGVALIGPSEPADRARHGGVFASHYDEGRMTRVSDADAAWAVTAARSIARYAEVEATSGIRFYEPSGYLGIGDAKTDTLAKAEAQGRAHGADVRRLDRAEMAKRFPYLELRADAVGLHERAPAGHVSPRAMVRAQSEAARRRGTAILDTYATALRAAPSGIEIESADGAVHRAERVLVAVGAYADACALLPVRLDLRVFGRTVVLARIDDDLGMALAGMPTLGHAESGAYILPPIPYPDGRRYLKIGLGSPTDRRLDTLAALNAWFKDSGAEANRRDFTAFITRLIPPLATCRHWHTDTCAVAQTVTGLPYIDVLDDPRIAVAIGGNGKGAKSSDDWGLLGARLVAGQDWDHPVPREALRLPHE
jgi:glycine/D-amino acid oxidase-like deaminating enzyme